MGNLAARRTTDHSQTFGSDEMTERIRTYAWRETTLGPAESWPAVLRFTLNHLLAACNPMGLMWGPQLIQLYNDGFRQSLGDKHPSCLGQQASLCWAELWDRILPNLDAAWKLGESGRFEDKFLPIAPQGDLRGAVWSYTYSPVRDLDGAICGVLVTGHATARSSIAEETLKQVLEAIPDGALKVDRSWRVQYLNHSAARLLAPTDCGVGADLRTVLSGMLQERSPSAEHLRRVMDEGADADFEAYCPAPLNLWLRVVAHPVADAILFFLRDITQRKREHAALIQSEKLAAVGRMASSIAHEINNPLESLTNLLYLLQHIDDREQRTNFLAQAQSELSRIARITTQTLRFHRQSSKPEPVRVRDILENVLTLMQARLRSMAVTVETDYRTERTIIGYEADLRQVFANLISNALDAANQGGRIILRVEESAESADVEPSVRVIIADNGHGMDPSTRQRIFEPFFTTRPLTGTGLGLWVSMEILNHHGAHVRLRSCQSDAHHGTVFSVIFPAEAPPSLFEPSFAV